VTDSSSRRSDHAVHAQDHCIAERHRSAAGPCASHPDCDPPISSTARSLRRLIPPASSRPCLGSAVFWGAERKFWELGDGVYATAVGYAGGHTPNPTYEETCSGRTGHTEVVLVVFDPKKVPYEKLLKTFWESHNPTQGMRQGNDVGTQYRSAIYTYSDAQKKAADASKALYQKALAAKRPRCHHHRDRTRRRILFRRGLPSAISGQESRRLLRLRWHRRVLPDRRWCERVIQPRTRCTSPACLRERSTRPGRCEASSRAWRVRVLSSWGFSLAEAPSPQPSPASGRGSAPRPLSASSPPHPLNALLTIPGASLELSRFEGWMAPVPVARRVFDGRSWQRPAALTLGGCMQTAGPVAYMQTARRSRFDGPMASPTAHRSRSSLPMAAAPSPR